jgi:hypothetical protein
MIRVFLLYLKGAAGTYNETAPNVCGGIISLWKIRQEWQSVITLIHCWWLPRRYYCLRFALKPGRLVKVLVALDKG